MRLTPRTLLLALLVLGGLAVLVERLIVTDTERLEIWAHDLAEAAASGQVDRVEPMLSEDFQFNRMDREQTLRMLSTVHKRYKPTGVEVRLDQVEIQEEGATAAARVIVKTREGLPYGFGFDLRFVRADDGFQLAEARMTQGPPLR